MSGKTFDAKISAAEAALQAARAEMEYRAKEFLAAVATFLREWYPEQAKREIAQAGDLAIKLGSTLSVLKKEVEELSNSAEATTETLVGAERLWPHRRSPLSSNPPDGITRDSPYREFANRLPEFLSEPINAAQGKLIALLKRRGITTAGEKDGRRDHQYETPSSYSIPYAVAEAFQPLLMAYVKAWKDGLAAERLVGELRRQKAAEAAEDLWDRA